MQMSRKIMCYCETSHVSLKQNKCIQIYHQSYIEQEMILITLKSNKCDTCIVKFVGFKNYAVQLVSNDNLHGDCLVA